MQAKTLDKSGIDWDATYVHKPFRKAAVLGAGTMGAQIAAHLANAGLEVVLLDIADEGTNRNAIVQKAFKQLSRLKPDPWMVDEAQKRITTGNFDDDIELIGDAEWVVEVVVERLDIKRKIMERIEQYAHPEAIISSNTSGLPIQEIAAERSMSFKKRFLGTHFFNPPRYLKLLELIATQETDSAIVQRIAHFGRTHLGKGIVLCKDTPNFIGNRIGVFALFRAIKAFTEEGYSIEEIDVLTGPFTGKPRSATFRTADVVGLDVLKHVAKNLYDNVPDDESRHMFEIPALLDALIEKGALGAKAGAGFYKKEGRAIRSIDPNSGEYTDAEAMDLGDVIQFKGSLKERLRTLYDDSGRAGAFFRAYTHDLLGYSARRVPEITDSPADIDKAMRWGFGWDMGPFEIWDALGFSRVLGDLKEQNVLLPDWIDDLATKENAAFYAQDIDAKKVFWPEKSAFVPDETPPDELTLAVFKSEERLLWSNDEAALLDMGDGVALYEFRSKANALGNAVMKGLMEAITLVEEHGDLRGMVIGNEGKNFSVGANLGEFGMAAGEGKFQLIESAISDFQQAVQRIRYATKPVVTAVHQMALGGGCEITMASPQPVLAAESYLGLVELGVGLIPAGTGTAALAARASRRASKGYDSEILTHLQGYFQHVAMAKVSKSGYEAIDMGLVPRHTQVVMRADRRLHVAKQAVIYLSESGYQPPPVQRAIRVLGKPGHAALEVMARQFEAGKFISAYDRYLASRLAYVMTGGGLSGPQEVDEHYLIELEREVFVSLLGEEKTRERIAHILKTNKPLRN